MPNATRIRELETELKRTQQGFQERYGCDAGVPLSDVFWTCSTIFSQSVTNSRQWAPRIFLFTVNDKPYSSSEQREAAMTRARDLTEQGVVIELFALPPPGRPFAMEIFWGSVVT